MTGYVETSTKSETGYLREVGYDVNGGWQMFGTFGRDRAKIRARGRDRTGHVNDGGLTRLQLCLSLVAPFVFFAVAGSLGGLAAIVFLLGALGGLGIAAAAFGADPRDRAER